MHPKCSQCSSNSWLRVKDKYVCQACYSTMDIVESKRIVFKAELKREIAREKENSNSRHYYKGEV